jgi:hypothetical protein
VPALLHPTRFPLAIEPGTAPHQWLVRIVDVPDLPVQRWALVIGDCVHNLRCALDHLALQLAGGDPTDTTTMFLISDDAVRYHADAKRRLKRVPTPMRERIESLQPFHAADPTHTDLWAINALDNTDKHRLLVVTVARGDQLHLEFGPHPGIDLKTQVRGPYLAPDEPLAVGAKVATFTFPRTDVEVTAKLIPFLAFGGDIWPEHEHVAVLESLRSMAGKVDRVLQIFEASFSA